MRQAHRLNDERKNIPGHFHHRGGNPTLVLDVVRLDIQPRARSVAPPHCRGVARIHAVGEQVRRARPITAVGLHQRDQRGEGKGGQGADSGRLGNGGGRAEGGRAGNGLRGGWRDGGGIRQRGGGDERCRGARRCGGHNPPGCRGLDSWQIGDSRGFCRAAARQTG